MERRDRTELMVITHDSIPGFHVDEADEFVAGNPTLYVLADALGDERKPHLGRIAHVA